MKKTGLETIKVTSTSRTPEHQAKIMYNNIVRYGVAHQKRLYGSAGDQVIDVYVTEKEANKTKDQIIQTMSDKILSIRKADPTKFKHVGDPNILNVIDIALSSIPSTHLDLFIEYIKNDSRIERYFKPPTDPAVHVEIPQSQKY